MVKYVERYKQIVDAHTRIVEDALKNNDLLIAENSIDLLEQLFKTTHKLKVAPKIVILSEAGLVLNEDKLEEEYNVLDFLENFARKKANECMELVVKKKKG
ncbi:hypothetical protein K9L97_03875 [Candidatus Woesearchaeota archaeon]|nr:hypothetical protein [Candidatus Woesearchaeota archaeon]